jgi:hypothetical protein
MQRKEASQLHRDAYAGGSCAEEEDAMFGEGPAGSEGGATGGVDEPAEDDGAGALDVVVEDGVFVAVSGEVFEGFFGSKVLPKAVFDE